MKEKIAKTNVARLLDKAKIAYELIPYEVDENDLSAVHVAASLITSRLCSITRTVLPFSTSLFSTFISTRISSK